MNSNTYYSYSYSSKFLCFRIVVPFEDKVSEENGGSSTYTAWYSEFRCRNYYSWVPGQPIPSKPFTVSNIDLSLAFAVYPNGNVVEGESKDYVSVYVHNCNEEPIYVHATLDFLGETHEIRHCIDPGVGFGCPGIVIRGNDDESSPPEFFDCLTCKFHLLTMNESDWMKYNETYELKKESQIRLNGVKEEDAEDFRTKLNDLTSLVLRLQSNLYLTQSKLHNMEEKAEHNMQKMEKLQNKMDLKLDMLRDYIYS